MGGVQRVASQAYNFKTFVWLNGTERNGTERSVPFLWRRNVHSVPFQSMKTETFLRATVVGKSTSPGELMVMGSSPTQGSQFFFENQVVLCCFAFLLCCCYLAFLSASLGVIVHAHAIELAYAQGAEYLHLQRAFLSWIAAFKQIRSSCMILWQTSRRYVKGNKGAHQTTPRNCLAPYAQMIVNELNYSRVVQNG